MRCANIKFYYCMEASHPVMLGLPHILLSKPVGHHRPESVGYHWCRWQHLWIPSLFGGTKWDALRSKMGRRLNIYKSLKLIHFSCYFCNSNFDNIWILGLINGLGLKNNSGLLHYYLTCCFSDSKILSWPTWWINSRKEPSHSWSHVHTAWLSGETESQQTFVSRHDLAVGRCWSQSVKSGLSMPQPSDLSAWPL